MHSSPKFMTYVMWLRADPSPDGKGTLQIKRGIEAGQIFNSVKSTQKLWAVKSLVKMVSDLR